MGDWGAIINGGSIVALVLFILAMGTGEKPRWVPGSTYRERVADYEKRIERLELRADEAAKTAERTVDVAQAMMDHIRGEGKRDR